MDRNIRDDVSYSIIVNVALRKESVDRNKAFSSFLVCGSSVALRKESVDRNSGRHINKTRSKRMSLSARRAWIEIQPGCA